VGVRPFYWLASETEALVILAGASYAKIEAAN